MSVLEEPEPTWRADPDAEMAGINREPESRPFQPAKAQHRQAWGIGGPRRVDHDALIQLQAERPIIFRLITPT